MFGNNPRVNPLELRKRLLISESELNRAHLAREWVAMTVGIRTLGGRVKSFGALASSAGLLVGGLAALRRGKPRSSGVRLSWLQTILKGAGMVSTFLLAFRSQSRHPSDK
jgi:hypothetical protein